MVQCSNKMSKIYFLFLKGCYDNLYSFSLLKARTEGLIKVGIQTKYIRWKSGKISLLDSKI